MIKRKQYVERLKNLLGIKVIKVITGLRRVGKSTLFRQFQQELQKSGVDSKNIIYLNLEEMENEALLERHVLNDYLMRIIDKNTTNYVFLDEVQMVPEFEKLVDSLFVKDFIDLYITGSNAWFLSSELSTLLTGRYIEIPVLPLSFKEFVSIFDEHKSKSEIFEDYLTYGGLPEVSNIIKLNNFQEVAPYLQHVYKTILEKDIYKRKKIKSAFDFENIVQFMLDGVGNIVSPNNIATTVTANGNKIDNETVENYLSALQESFLLYKTFRYDIKGKKLLQTLNKFYCVDIGFVSALLGREASVNRGRLLENIVYLELLRRYKTLFIGKTGEKEVDFIAIDNQGYTHYYQVTLTMREESTRERELSAFDSIRDHNPKFVISLDPEEPVYNGIICKNVIKWLLE
jgi:predicted AAA+ superfamily ATPase